MALFGRKKNHEEVVVVEEPQPRDLPGAPTPLPDGLRAPQAHVDFLLGLIDPLPPFGMGLLDGVGLTLCEDLEADQNQPRLDMALIPGVAVRAADVAGATQDAPIRLHIAAELAEGDVAEGAIEPGEGVIVVAGSPLPDGCDAVVPPTATMGAADGGVRVFAPVQPGENIRQKGSEVAEGEVLLRRGVVLDPRTAGRLASVGIDRVIVRPRPRVVVVATGTDLIDPSVRSKKDSDNYDATSYLVAAAAKLDGAQVWRVPVRHADVSELKLAITDQLIRSDILVITTGGSRAEYDNIKAMLPELGLVDFADVAMEPGRAQGVAIVGNDDEKVPVLLLPGNPVSSYVSYIAFVRPLIRKLMAREPYAPKPMRAITTSLIRSTPGKVSMVRGIVTEEIGGRRVVEPLPTSSEHLLGDLAIANALIVIPAEVEAVRAGDPVQVLMLDEE